MTQNYIIYSKFNARVKQSRKHNYNVCNWSMSSLLPTGFAARQKNSRKERTCRAKPTTIMYRVLWYIKLFLNLCIGYILIFQWGGLCAKCSQITCLVCIKQLLTRVKMSSLCTGFTEKLYLKCFKIQSLSKLLLNQANNWIWLSGWNENCNEGFVE